MFFLNNVILSYKTGLLTYEVLGFFDDREGFETGKQVFLMGV